VIESFCHYLEKEEARASRAEFTALLQGHLADPGFRSDMDDLLRMGIDYDLEEAARVVQRELIDLLPPWEFSNGLWYEFQFTSIQFIKPATRHQLPVTRYGATAPAIPRLSRLDSGSRLGKCRVDWDEKSIKQQAMSSALQYLTNEEGQKTAVIIPMEDYIKFLEDLEDLAAVAERREEPRLNHDQFLAELRKDGILHDHLA
jgi:hypothetical protein